MFIGLTRKLSSKYVIKSISLRDLEAVPGVLFGCGVLSFFILFGVFVGVVLALNNSVATCALKRFFETFFVLFNLRMPN